MAPPIWVTDRVDKVNEAVNRGGSPRVQTRADWALVVDYDEGVGPFAAGAQAWVQTPHGWHALYRPETEYPAAGDARHRDFGARLGYWREFPAVPRWRRRGAIRARAWLEAHRFAAGRVRVTGSAGGAKKEAPEGPPSPDGNDGYDEGVSFAEGDERISYSRLVDAEPPVRAWYPLPHDPSPRERLRRRTVALAELIVESLVIPIAAAKAALRIHNDGGRAASAPEEDLESYRRRWCPIFTAAGATVPLLSLAQSLALRGAHGRLSDGVLTVEAVWPETNREARWYYGRGMVATW